MTDLPKGWAVATLEQLAAPDRPICYGILMPKEHVQDGVPYVKVKDFPNGSINVAALRRTSSAIAAKYERSTLQPGDVLVSIRGTYGRVAIVPNELAGANITQDTARVTPSDVIDRRFLAHFLRSQDAQRFFRQVARGVAVKGVNLGDLRQLRCPLPPLAEQERIVAAVEEQLSRLDDAAQVLLSARRRLTHLRSSVLDAVTRVDGDSVALGEIADVVGGVTKDSKRQHDPSFIEVPYLRVANVQRGYLNLSEITTIRVSPEKAKALRLEPGDILFNEGGDRDKLGRGWIWNGEIDDCIHQNHVFRARIVSTEFDPKFVSIHGNTFGRRWFEEMGKQTTNLASINLKTLKSFPVPVLPLDEQRQRVEEAECQITVFDALLAAIDRALVRSDQLRRAVLSEAFSGRLVPQDPGESASELLARIAVERPAPPKPRQGKRV